LPLESLAANGQPTVQVLIRQNNPVPAAASTTFYTTRDDQMRLIIEAVQQRDTGVDSGEVSLGFFAFMIERPREQYPLDIELAYDLEGIVTATARDPETGRQVQQVMDEDSEGLDRALLEQQGWINQLQVNV